MKATIIGGGSYGWAIGFMRQLIGSEVLPDLRVTLMDLDPEALGYVAKAVAKYQEIRGTHLPVETTTDLDAALDGADFVLVSISTGGLEAMRADVEIPEQYGIWHTVGDTVGPGGWCRAVRNVYVFDDLGRRMKARCPDAWMLNVSNPLTVLTRTPRRNHGIRSIGMCPGVEGHVASLTRLAKLEGAKQVDYTVTGIDHGSWLTRLMADGVDVLERLRELGFCRSDDQLPGTMKSDDPMPGQFGSRAIFAAWRELGYMPGINDRHAIENWPWFLTDPAGKLEFGIVRTKIAERYEWRKIARKRLEDFIRTGELGGLGHGDDPVVAVIECLLGKRSLLFGANYENVGQIPQLPLGAVVETRCRFDGAGVHPEASPMPPLLTALVAPHVLRQEMVIDIALHGSFDELAALVTTDPLCTRLKMGQARAMVRQMIQANAKYIKNPRLLE